MGVGGGVLEFDLCVFVLSPTWVRFDALQIQLWVVFCCVDGLVLYFTSRQVGHTCDEFMLHSFSIIFYLIIHGMQMLHIAEFQFSNHAL